MRTSRSVVSAIGAVLALGVTLGLGACAQNGATPPAEQPGGPTVTTPAAPDPSTPSAGTGPTGTPTGSPSRSKTPRQPTPSQPAGTTTLTGMIEEGVEPGCLLLDDYLLVGGPRDLIRAGARVSVTGRVEPGLMTTCQQGTPFLVASARAA